MSSPALPACRPVLPPRRHAQDPPEGQTPSEAGHAKKRRLHHLPHVHRRSVDASDRNGAARLRRLPRRRCIGSPAAECFSRRRRVSEGEAIGASQAAHRDEDRGVDVGGESRCARTPTGCANRRNTFSSSIRAISAWRIAHAAPATPPEVQRVRTSMMTHGAMLWGAALYNNGALPDKNPRFGESYSRDGTPQRLLTWPPPTAEETAKKGVLPFLDPLERWEVSQPGNVLRVFERGRPQERRDRQSRARGRSGTARGQARRARLRHAASDRSGLPRPSEDAPARSVAVVSRAPTISPATIAAAAAPPATSSTPTTARPITRAQYAAFGNEGRSASNDPTISKTESGHPHQARVHAVDSVEPVHDLPHAPGHEHGDHLLRLHLVGERNRRRVDVPEGAARAERSVPPAGARAQSRRRGAARPVVGRRVPEENWGRRNSTRS